MSKPKFLASSLDLPPSKSSQPHYKGEKADALLPPKGVPVYADHPIFTSDAAMKHALDALKLHLVLVRGNGGKGDEETWLFGEAPIPEMWLDWMIGKRHLRAEEYGLSPSCCVRSAA